MTNKTSSLLLLFILTCLFSIKGLTQEEAEALSTNPQAEVIEQLRSLMDTIAEQKASVRDIDKQLKVAELPSEIKQLTEEKNQVQKKLEKNLKSIEQIATGAVDLSLFEQPESRNFSWQEELKEVFRPILFELKKITERPRQIEQLRGKQESLDTKIEAATLAIGEIESVNNTVKSETLTQLLKKWQQRREDLQNSAALVEFQLNEKMTQGEGTSAAVIRAIKGFFTGRGLNLLLALSVFFGTFISLRYFSHRLEHYISRGQDKERRFFARLLHIAFQVLTVGLALLALMVTLYILSDWLLLTLFVIVTVGFIFALRNSLPRYIDEARLLLNIGPVREGERVIYNGLPWKVSRLNIYSDLVNPLLTGGRLRLPMPEMLNLVSRRWARSEPWFPCKPNDYVVMADDTYGKVALQTPEVVKLHLLGGATKSYTTDDFVALTPSNLSDGFGFFVSFGLDYALQAHITSVVVEKLEVSLRQYVEKSNYDEFVKNLHVEFDEAGASSLNLLIVAIFSGEAAQHYYPIKRFLQRAAVDACNEHNWTIPFNQLTVHMNSGQS